MSAVKCVCCNKNVATLSNPVSKCDCGNCYKSYETWIHVPKVIRYTEPKNYEDTPQNIYNEN